MMELFKNDKFRFFTKITLAHVIAYTVVTLMAIPLTLNYGDSVVELMGFKPLDEISMGAVFFGQIIRGLLLGIVIWWIKDSIMWKKLGWLKLWAILVILGIFNTYGPTHGSIQGMIYLDMSRFADLPPITQLSMLEVLLQPLLFSIIVTYKKKIKHENV